MEVCNVCLELTSWFSLTFTGVSRINAFPSCLHLCSYTCETFAIFIIYSLISCFFCTSFIYLSYYFFLLYLIIVIIIIISIFFIIFFTSRQELALKNILLCFPRNPLLKSRKILVSQNE